ncbi:hypothetical protein G7A66_10895 [Altererythrobacter sp. SALINAS58]|uniref:hypothetical protein n=1 Tax=Alteripontixanthobacter muriae TaxID=2705546 RepID=UPI0015759FC5|nr:hypothetical protein [Alteripontixanthobacter muriae]NTZ43579.1 hypothetical protein [Alteripontixanthobacter muriae]
MRAFLLSVAACAVALFSPQAHAANTSENVRGGKGKASKVKKVAKASPRLSASRAVVKVTRGARLRIVRGKAELKAKRRTQQTVAADGRNLFEFQ